MILTEIDHLAIAVCDLEAMVAAGATAIDRCMSMVVVPNGRN